MRENLQENQFLVHLTFRSVHSVLYLQKRADWFSNGAETCGFNDLHFIPVQSTACTLDHSQFRYIINIGHIFVGFFFFFFSLLQYSVVLCNSIHISSENSAAILRKSLLKTWFIFPEFTLIWISFK